MAMLLKLAPGLFRVHVHPHLLRLFFRFPCSSSSESRCGANYGIATPRALLSVNLATGVYKRGVDRRA